MNSCQQFEG